MDHVPLKPGPTIRVRYLPPVPLKPRSHESGPFDDLPPATETIITQWEWYAGPRQIVSVDLEDGIYTYAALLGDKSVKGQFNDGQPVPGELREAILAVTTT